VKGDKYVHQTQRKKRINKPNPREDAPPRVETRRAVPLVFVAETKADQVEPWRIWLRRHGFLSLEALGVRTVKTEKQGYALPGYWPPDEASQSVLDWITFFSRRRDHIALETRLSRLQRASCRANRVTRCLSGGKRLLQTLLSGPLGSRPAERKRGCLRRAHGNGPRDMHGQEYFSAHWAMRNGLCSRPLGINFLGGHHRASFSAWAGPTRFASTLDFAAIADLLADEGGASLRA